MSDIVRVVVGVDTHAATHHVAVLDAVSGRQLGDREVRADQQGYEQALLFASSYGLVVRFGVEGTSSYGAGLARYLRGQGVEVKEIIRPRRSHRRLKGKSDPLDALEAARAVLDPVGLPTPKAGDGLVEAIRVTHTARSSAVKAHGAAIRQIRSLMVTAPQEIRSQLEGLPAEKLVARLASSRPAGATTSAHAATWHALRHLARRYRDLGEEIDQHTLVLEVLVREVNPALLAAHGVGTIHGAQLLITAGDNPERLNSEASFAALCGTNPLPASSGQTTRHRLNRGGDRHANSALHLIALTRMNTDARTRSYVKTLTARGKTKNEILRILKRAIAREMYHHLQNPHDTPIVDDLRPLRKAAKLTLQDVADHFQTTPTRISRIERGKQREDTFTTTYRTWLHTHAS